MEHALARLKVSYRNQFGVWRKIVQYIVKERALCRNYLPAFTVDAWNRRFTFITANKKAPDSSSRGSCVNVMCSLATKNPLRIFNRICGCLDGNHSCGVHCLILGDEHFCSSMLVFMSVVKMFAIRCTVYDVVVDVNRVKRIIHSPSDKYLPKGTLP